MAVTDNSLPLLLQHRHLPPSFVHDALRQRDIVNQSA